MPLLQPHFNTLSDEKLQLILKVGELQNASEAGIGKTPKPLIFMVRMQF